MSSPSPADDALPRWDTDASAGLVIHGLLRCGFCDSLELAAQDAQTLVCRACERLVLTIRPSTGARA